MGLTDRLLGQFHRRFGSDYVTLSQEEIDKITEGEVNTIGYICDTYMKLHKLIVAGEYDEAKRLLEFYLEEESRNAESGIERVESMRLVSSGMRSKLAQELRGTEGVLDEYLDSLRAKEEQEAKNQARRDNLKLTEN